MQYQRRAVIGRRRNDPRLDPDNVGVVVMPSCLIGVGKPVAGAECQNGGESDDDSHQHDLYPFKRFRSKMRPASVWSTKFATSVHRPLRYFRSILEDRTMDWRHGFHAISAATRSSAADRAPGPEPPAHSLQAIP